MGCGASKDAASGPGPCGAKKKKRNKETEAEVHQEEAESQLLLSSSQKQSEEFQERFHAEVGLRVQVDLEQYPQVQPAVPALPLVVVTPVGCSTIEEVGLPQAHFVLPSPAQLIADSKGSSPSAAGCRTSTTEQVHSLDSPDVWSPTAPAPAPAPQPAWQSRTPPSGNSAPQSRQASGRSTPVELKAPASNIPVEFEAASSPVGGSRQSSGRITPLASYPAAESRQSSGRNTYLELKAPSPSVHSRQSSGRNELKTPESRLSSGRSTPVELKASYPAVETRESSGRSTPLELKASSETRQSSGRSTPLELKALHPAAETRQSSGWSISEMKRQSSGQGTPVESNAESKPPSPAVLRKAPVLEHKLSSQASSPAHPAAGSAAQSKTSSPRDLAHSSRTPSTVGTESKNPTPRQNSSDFRNLSRTPSPASAGPAQSVPLSRTASPGQSAPVSPGPSASPSPGHSTRSIPASPHRSPGASAQNLPASPHSVPTSRKASQAASAPPSIPTSRTASPAELKASRTSSAQPNEDGSVSGSSNAFPLPSAEFKRIPSAASSETSKTSSPRIPDFKAQRGSRTPPAPAAPQSRTPPPAPAQVPESKLELRKPAKLSQEEPPSQFSSYPSSPAAEPQESVTAPLPRSTTSPRQYTDEQRKRLLADLVEKISRSSSGTSVASLKGSRSSSKSPAPSHHSKASSNSPAMSCKESRASSRVASTVSVDEDLSATAAAALQAIVNSVTSGLEARDEDGLSAHDEVEAAEFTRDVPEAFTQAAQPRQVDEAFREKGARAAELRQDVEQGDEDEDLATPENLESILSCVEIKRCQSQANASADTENTGVPSPRPGLLDYYLGLRSGEYKLSSPSSSASSQNEALADIKSAIDDLDLTKEQFAEDSTTTTTSLDDVYNEIRKLKFSNYGLQQGSNVSNNTVKTEMVTMTTTSTTKVQMLEQVASPLSSKGSVEEGDVFMHKFQSLLTRMT